MIKTLHIENFTVFSQADFEFSKGLNVIVGENGTGKSHILKLAYASLRALPEHDEHISDLEASIRLSNSLVETFSLKNISALKRVHTDGETVIHITDERKKSIVYKILDKSGTIFVPKKSINDPGEYVLGATVTNNMKFMKTPSIFIPPKEILSVYRGFRAALKSRELDFDATYLDLAEALDRRPYKDEKLKEIERMYKPVEKLINAKAVQDDTGGFSFSVPYKKTQPGYISQTASMFAEGHRKLGMLAYLIRNGSIGKGSILFWDEPEANLNPKLIKELAAVLVRLSRDVQIFIATHSLFLLRELEIFQSKKRSPAAQYFGLHFTDSGIAVRQGHTCNDIGDIAALDASLDQSERYLEATEGE